MINKIIKIVLAVVLLGLAVYSFIDGEIGNGIFFFLMITFPVLLFFRHERVVMALWHLRKQNFDKAQLSLNKISQPEHLLKTQEAYYYYLQGFCTMAQQKEVNKAGPMFRKALSIGLRMKQDEAVAKLSLAQLAIMNRRKREAKNYLYEVKKIKESSSLKSEIKQVEMMLKRI
ncbi:MAG: tetratricopeptide repeat protein [Bacteroidia bacterium]